MQDQIVGNGFFTRSVWRKTAPFTVPVGLCEPSADKLTFRTTPKGDVEKAIPMAMPQMNVSSGPHGPGYRRQLAAYPLPKKVRVHSDGRVLRATDSEIVDALQDVALVDDDLRGLLGGLTGPEYVLAVTEMFKRRR